MMNEEMLFQRLTFYVGLLSASKARPATSHKRTERVSLRLFLFRDMNLLLLEAYFHSKIHKLIIENNRFDHIKSQHHCPDTIKSYFYEEPTKQNILSLAEKAAEYGEIDKSKSTENHW